MLMDKDIRQVNLQLVLPHMHNKGMDTHPLSNRAMDLHPLSNKAMGLWLLAELLTDPHTQGQMCLLRMCLTISFPKLRNPQHLLLTCLHTTLDMKIHGMAILLSLLLPHMHLHQTLRCQNSISNNPLQLQRTKLAMPCFSL